MPLKGVESFQAKVPALSGKRSLTILGLDYLFTLYLYFPEESKVQKNEIYSALRNPFYAAFLIIGLGGAILTCTLYTFIIFIFYFIGFYIFLRFVEERELL
jgi:protein-S-isoprenylcysteine O-methyltransferase Ste14